jgi:hypothetical protein
MTPELLSKIRSLVNDGATVVGLPPQKSPSLTRYPKCDEEVQRMAHELWGGNEAPATQETRSFGKGKVIWNQALRDEADYLYPTYDYTARILASMDVPPDFESAGGQVRFTHRTMDDCDIYFVSNRSEKKMNDVCKFRTTGKKPELWNPMTGERRLLPDYAVTGKQTVIPLQFDVYEGYFIIFRDHTTLKPSVAKVNFSAGKPIATIDGAWEVSFDPVWGGPEKITFDKLTDWTQHPEPGIRYYSGTAVYRKTFDAPETKSQICIDLGKVKHIARVRLNGRDLGVVWTAPWRVDATGVIKAKGNRLEIEVINLWPNRLIGDEQLPDDGIKGDQWPEWLKNGTPRTSGRYTFTTYKHYTKDSPLLESGLIGPVTIQSTDRD